MIRAYVAAILAALRADPLLEVYDSAVPPNPDLPYVVFWAAADRRSSDRATRVQWNADLFWQTTCVGGSPEQARAAQERVHDRLLDLRLQVAGRTTAPVQHLASPVMTRDDSLPTPLFVGVDQWGALSVPG